MAPSDEQRELMQRYLDGNASEQEVNKLTEAMESDSEPAPPARYSFASIISSSVGRRDSVPK